MTSLRDDFQLSLIAAQRQESLGTALAFIAGFLDGYGMITYGTYLSFMSGNTTQTGYRIGQGVFGAAVPSAIAILFFVVGSFSGGLLVHFTGSRAPRLVFAAIALCLALVIGFTQVGLLYAALHIATISFAMGAMNTALSHVGALSISLTFVTGTLSRLGMHLASAVVGAPLRDSEGAWDTHMHRALLLAGIWGSFLSGALLSGAATPRFGAWVLVLPTLGLSALAVFYRTRNAAD